MTSPTPPPAWTAETEAQAKALVEAMRQMVEYPNVHFHYVEDRLTVDLAATALTAAMQEITRLSALAEKSRREENEAWQPMEAAPKDGTWILVNFWYGQDVVNWKWGGWFNDLKRIDERAICWMSIPAIRARLNEDASGEKEGKTDAA